MTRKHAAKDASPQAEMKRLRGENGVEMLEFALVIPIFVFVLYGLIAFGMMLSAKQTIVHAASEGARAAVGATPQGDVAAEIAAAKSRVDQAMKSLGQYDVNAPGAFDAQVQPCSGGTGNCITVKVIYDYASHPIVPPAPGLGLVTPDKLSSIAVVQVS